MKTTIELPDELFREAKALAARRGELLKDIVREALEEKVTRAATLIRPGEWPVPPMPLSPDERRRFDEAIEEVFEQIDPEENLTA